jgi:hypothetical protein
VEDLLEYLQKKKDNDLAADFKPLDRILASSVSKRYGKK